MSAEAAHDILNAPEVTAAHLKRGAAPLAPLPLPDALPAVPAFNPLLLPDPFRPWVEDIAERMQCPSDFPAIGAMIALAAVVGRQVGIRPKRRDDWTVIPNLWGAVVGRPGLMKSPALSQVLHPLQRLEAAAREAFKEEGRKHEARGMVGKAAAKQGEEDIRKAVKAGDHKRAESLALGLLGDGEEPPQRRRYLSNDPTVEKLGELLAANPRGVLVFRDELTGFLRSLDKDGREGARAFYLEAWNGDAAHTCDRIGRGTVDIEAACVSILGGIQPGPLSEYLRGALYGGGDDDGLLQRFQLVTWPDPSGTWRNVDRWPDTDAKRAAWEVFERLDALDARAFGAEGDGDGVAWLRFDAEAQEVFDPWRADLEARLRSDRESPAFEGHLSKYRSLVPSLALLVHLAEGRAGPVGLASTVAAVAWAEYLEGHARRLYSPALEPALTAARELDRHLLAGDLPDPFTAREVYVKGWRLLDRQGAADALDYLEDLGRVVAESVPPRTVGGRPTVSYRLHPALKEGVGR